jgi:hypothetical protein
MKSNGSRAAPMSEHTTDYYAVDFSIMRVERFHVQLTLSSTVIAGQVLV